MSGLLIKDWKIFKNQGRYFLMAVVVTMAVILCMGITDYMEFVISYMTFFSSYFVTSTISYDMYDNGMEFLMTLPVDRKLYVQEKYLLGIFVIGSTWFVMTLTNAFLLAWSGAAFPSWEKIFSTVIFLTLAFFFVGVSLPLFLKFGPEKGRIVFFIILGIFFLGTILSVKTGIGIPAVNAIDRGSMEHPLLMAGISLGAGILFLFVSYLMAMRIMEKKEF